MCRMGYLVNLENNPMSTEARGFVLGPTSQDPVLIIRRPDFSLQGHQKIKDLHFILDPILGTWDPGNLCFKDIVYIDFHGRCLVQ